MADVQVAIHGAGQTVTGSCYEVRWGGGHRILVDCGLFLTHGEASAIEGLRRDLQARCASIITPEIGEVYSLPAGAPARRLATRRTNIREAVGRDWQNDYADFTVRLKRELQAIEAAGKRREAIARMRAILTEYQHTRARGNGGG